MKTYDFYNLIKLPNRHFLIFGLLAIATINIAVSSPVFSQTKDETKQSVEREKQVREFVESFNARDIKQMLGLAHDNIQWVSVDREKSPIETDGIKALQVSMESYFRSCSSCKSTLEWVQSAGNRVTTLERADWNGKNGARSQKGLAVYEFKDGKIWRVFYFPAENMQK